MARDKRPLNRRDFFQELVGRWLKPASKEVSTQLKDYVNQVVPADRQLLRPPGALHEREFLETCLHSGQCVDRCPAQAIQTYLGERQEWVGTPFIDPDQQPCVVCESLACMAACPSGALRMLDVHEIRMGNPQWHLEACVRTSGEPCIICVDKCPLGSKAIELNEQEIVFHNGCVGCGVCQHECPADAIHIQPI